MSTRAPDAVRLTTLVQVARHGSLTGAAQALGLTTSAVSQQMSALESECGVSLIERQSRGVTLTGDGLVLLEQAEQLVRHLDETRATMAQLSGELAGRVRVASIASGAAALVLPASRVLETSAPAVTMGVRTMEPSASIDAVLDGSVDVALIDVYDHVPIALPSQLLVEEVLTEPLVLVVSRDSGVPARATLSRLKDERWVIPPAQAACGAATRHACRSAGFEPDVAWETDDLLLIVAAASRGEGIALLPRLAVADSVAPVELRRLVDPALTRGLQLVSRRTTAQRPTVRACMDAIHHVARSATRTAPGPAPRPASGRA